MRPLFVAVCEERNIARAAEREALVASAVSKRITAIEREVGSPLLIRGRRGIRPTAAGQALLRHAREVLGALGRMRAELSEFAIGVQGSIRVVASVSVLAERLPEDIAAFLAKHQSVRVSLDEMTSVEIVRSVREGAADIGVLWDLADLSGLQLLFCPSAREVTLGRYDDHERRGHAPSHAERDRDGRGNRSASNTRLIRRRRGRPMIDV